VVAVVRRPRIELDVAEVEALLVRIEPQIAPADHACLKSIVDTLIEATRLVQQRGATIARLRRMLGTVSSEKTANVVGTNGAAAASSSTNTDPTASAEGEPVAEPAAGAPSATPAKDGNAAAAEKPKRKGHGRIPASAYKTESIAVPHPTVSKGQACPKCARGGLYSVEPASCVRVFGQAPLVALRWQCECLRCSGCGHVFTAPLPEQARGPKYSESAASMMVVLRYGMGMPLHRLERMQRMLGAAVPASTQWEVARDRVPEILPVYDALVSRAADARLVQNDDTYVRILDLMGARREKLVTAGALDLPERTGLFTTGIVASTEAGPIALFASGRQHAGENLADLLVQRDPSLPPPVQMCDGLERNLPAGHDVVRANCLVHGRRHVVEEVSNHPELCAHVLEQIGTVFWNEARCRREDMTGDKRLAFHQRETAPVLASLYAWIIALFADKRVEENSGLGGALRYLLDRWDRLTLFLRVADAPLENNAVERILKLAIRQRRASLFYRTMNGAFVGDVYTALIVTTLLHGGDPFHYLTTLFTHHKAAAEVPDDWLPWTYRDTLARLERPIAAAA
jgi:hypothetical protein